MTQEPISDVVLAHHGVKGMKWGVRKKTPSTGVRGVIGGHLDKRRRAVERRKTRLAEMQQARKDRRKGPGGAEGRAAHKAAKQKIRAKSGRSLNQQGYMGVGARYVGKQLAGSLGVKAAGTVASKLGVSNTAVQLGTQYASAFITGDNQVRAIQEVRDIKAYRDSKKK